MNGRRVEQEVHSETDPHGFSGGDARRETHPAFGVAVVSRGFGGGRSLFQSDVLHNESITLSIQSATRFRDLNRDWVHPEHRLVEVEMSLAQWGALVSAVGIGSGVPVTIRATESNQLVPDIPYEPRIAESVSETKDAVGKLLERVAETLEQLDGAIEKKQGIRAVREALRRHTAAINNAKEDAGYAVNVMARAAEDVVSQAKSDIESHILAAAELTGQPAPLSLPELGVSEDPTHPQIEDA